MDYWKWDEFGNVSKLETSLPGYSIAISQVFGTPVRILFWEKTLLPKTPKWFFLEQARSSS